jgi:hypothetical protein
MTAAVEPSPIRRRTFPPVAQLSVASLALVVVGGIVVSSYAPRRPPLGAPVALLVAAVVLLAAAVVMLVRIREFAWPTFILVGKWALLAYIVSGGMIEFAFVNNHTRGAPLVVVTSLLIVFVLNVPLIIAFTVARYQEPAARATALDMLADQA